MYHSTISFLSFFYAYIFYLGSYGCTVNQNPHDWEVKLHCMALWTSVFTIAPGYPKANMWSQKIETERISSCVCNCFLNLISHRYKQTPGSYKQCHSFPIFYENLDSQWKILHFLEMCKDCWQEGHLAVENLPHILSIL